MILSSKFKPITNTNKITYQLSKCTLTKMHSRKISTSTFEYLKQKSMSYFSIETLPLYVASFVGTMFGRHVYDEYLLPSKIDRYFSAKGVNIQNILDTNKNLTVENTNLADENKKLETKLDQAQNAAQGFFHEMIELDTEKVKIQKENRSLKNELQKLKKGMNKAMLENFETPFIDVHNF